MPGNSGLSAINYFKTGSLSASSQEVTLPVTNLAGDQVNASSGWQSLNGDVSDVTLTCTFPSPAIIARGFGLFGTNLTPSAVVQVDALLSGSPVATATLPGPQEGYGQIVGVFSDNVTADALQFTITDAGNPDNHINVGAAFAGQMWFPQSGISWNTTYGENVARDDFRARGGPRFINPLYVERYWRLVLDSVRSSEAWDDLGELKRIAALGVNILFLPDVTDVDLYRMAVFGVLETQADVSFPVHSVDARQVTMQVTERK